MVSRLRFLFFFLSSSSAWILRFVSGSSSYLPSSVEQDVAYYESASDANLHRMTFDLGYGPESFDAYIQPDIAHFSQGNHTQSKTPSFEGHGVKFFNMSPTPVRLYWVNTNTQEHISMGDIRPFHSSGTGSFPGHEFFLAPVHTVEHPHDDVMNHDLPPTKTVLQYFIIDQTHRTNHYYYDPLTVENDVAQTNRNLSKLTLDQLKKYNIMKRNRDFSQKYYEFTGREYMTIYPRPKPLHFMWPADFFGQIHWVTSPETQFHTLPSSDRLQPIRLHPLQRAEGNHTRALQEYRGTEEYLNFTIQVKSCAPRVYEIENFLSETEVDYIVHYAQSVDMKQSSTGNPYEKNGSEKKTKTRTSYNTWVSRETNPIFDAIYRRAAHVLRIDEGLFRQRDPSEHTYMRTLSTVAEQLQLVHYDKYQEYTAHHDFGYASVTDRMQPARFATLLLYLNDVEEGGETEFPRWYNGETTEGLYVKPKKGNAALFYSFLSDGNLDDLSQHAAKPVIKGEKYLINLWVRDPDFEYSE